MSAALAIDLGGTNLRAGLSRDAGEPTPLGHWRAPTDLAGFRDRIGGLIGEHAVTRLGIAIPGLAAGTKSAWVPNLPYLDGEDMTDLFPGVRVAIGNDAHMALLAEAALGAARDSDDAILLAIGTGIGSAVLADRRIVRGASGGATSFGWACADPSDSGDEAHGWLERHASGRALDAIACEQGHDDGATLIAAARSGDTDAVRSLETPAAALGTALAGAVALLGTRLVVVSGGVADSLDILGPMIGRHLARQLPPHLRAVAIVEGRYGAGASLVGAGLAAQGHALWTGRDG